MEENEENNKSENIIVKSQEKEQSDKKIISEEEIKNHDSFCDFFVISSLSKENGVFIENSERLLSCCKHKDCQMLPAIEPILTYQYPQATVKNFTIDDSLVSAHAFPNGIKVCYEQGDLEKCVRIFEFNFTDLDNNRRFCVAYQFYLKMKNSEYKEKYHFNPIEKKLKELETLKETDKDKWDEQKYNKLKELDQREYVYIPCCACLISRYPYSEQMEKCLVSIILSIYNNNKADCKEKININKLIKYLVAIPVPPHHFSFSFPLPYCENLVEIKEPYLLDRLEAGNKCKTILRLPAEDIYDIFKLLVLEQKILFVGNFDRIMADTLYSFIFLIYPLNWTNLFMILNYETTEYLDSFQPFLFGINSSLFSEVKSTIAKNDSLIFIYNLDDHKFTTNQDLKENVKKKKASTLIKELPDIPKQLKNLLKTQLEKISKKFKNYEYKNKNGEENLRMQNLFMRIFVEMFKSCDKYAHDLIGEKNTILFNSKLFIAEKNEEEKEFYKQFANCQMSEVFIQEQLGNKKHFSINVYQII